MKNFYFIISLCRTEKSIYEKYKSDEKAYANYEVDATVAESEKEDLQQGTYVTNCRVCNVTCHDNCQIPNDDDKAGCAAMKPQGELFDYILHRNSN